VSAAERRSPGAPPRPGLDVPGGRLLAGLPWLCRPPFLAALYAALAIAAAITPMLRPAFGNFDIFRHSFLHLAAGTGLYVHYPAEPGDLFKYSPTFALAMAPFALLPRWLGMAAWNLLNALAPWAAVQRLPLSREARAFVLLFAAVELLVSLQNLQSNGLVAALMIGTFAAFERERPVLAALCVCLAFYIKIFGAAAAILFVLYRRRGAFLTACLVIGAALALAPLPVTGIDGFFAQYLGWADLLRHDQVPNNLSLIGFLDDRLGLDLPNAWVEIVGLILLLAPLARRRCWPAFAWRLAYLGSLMMWVVVFNHKSESPTFVIAMLGVALAAVAEPASLARTLLLAAAFVLTSLSSTDVVPRSVRQSLVRPLAVKAWPVFVLWAASVLRLATAPAARPDTAVPDGAGGGGAVSRAS
jgi:hypothetical protein